jgi:hypothetical protein
MGFELDRLMKEFGVSTPSLNYSGTGVPIDPGTRPVATATLTGDALTSAQAGYDNLLAKYNIDKANYPADQALYNTYKTEYQNRLLGTPQYMQAQFQTGYEPKSAGYQWATNPNVDPATGLGMGLKQYNTNIQNYATQNPTANTAAINAYADKYGISGQDIYNATNNRWGNTLQVPKYGTLTGDVGPVTPLPLVCGTGMKPNAAGTACIPDTTGAIVCGPGMTLNAAGTACVPIVTGGLTCGVGMEPNADGTACVPIVVKPEECPTGMTRGPDGVTCVPIVVKPDECPTGMTLGEDGVTCVPIVTKPDGCPTGMTLGEDGVTCVPIVQKPDGCPTGMTLGEDGVTCVPIVQKPDECPVGMTLGEDGVTCVPIVQKPDGCPTGMTLGEDGVTCVPIVEKPDGCPTGMTLGPDGVTCVPIVEKPDGCPTGMTLGPDGVTCVPIVVKPDGCPTGMTLGADGVTCVPIIDTPAPCGLGMVRNAQGECVPIVDTPTGLNCGVGMTPNAAGTACVPIGDTKTTGLNCGVGMKPNAEGTACVADSTLTTLTSIIGGNANDVIQDDGTIDSILNTISTLKGGGGNDVISDDGTTAGILSTIAALNGTTGTSSVTGANGNDVVADDGTTASILNTIADLNATTGNSAVTGTTGNDLVSDDGTSDSILNTIAGLNGTSGNGAVTGATTVDSVTGLDTTGNGAGTGLNTNLESITDLGNGLFSVENGDGTQSVFTDDGTYMGATGGGSKEDWEGNRVLTGIPNLTIQSLPGNKIGDVNEIHYFPEGAEQVQRYNDYINSLSAGEFLTSGGGGGGGLGKYMDDFSSAAFAKGGHVKTHYNNGGPLQLPSRVIRSSDAFRVQGAPYDPAQVAAADAYNDILRARVYADNISGRANDPMYGVADARELETRANSPERGFTPLVAQRELLNRSNEGEFAAAGYGDLGQFAGSFDPANVPMGDNRYSPADQYRMIARDASIVNSIADGSAKFLPRDGGRASMANLMGDSDAGRFAVSGYGDLGQFAGSFKDDNPYNTDAFAHGGRVKTHFQTGGANQATDIDQMAENYGVSQQPDMMSYQGSKLFPMQGQAPAPVSNQMTRRDAYPPTPQSPMDARATQLDALLQRYAGNTTDYSSELEKARKTADSESMAFQKMIQEAMKGSADAAPSKAEMYFRLASAFGSPTKTGHFAESLGNVNKELAAYSKDERDARKAQRALQLQMGLEGQKMRVASAKDDLTTLRSLASEEMKSKRAITAEVIKDFIKSGEPESAAGKQAKDEGLKVGTPEFKARVNEIAQTSVDAKLAQVTAQLAGMSVQQANANLAIQKFQNLQEQQTKLTPAEVALKTQTEDMLGSTTQAMEDLKRAYALNPNTFDTSLPDIAQRKLLEAAGSKDPKLANTREQANLLDRGALAQLKATFPGAISDAETRALRELQGLGAKSVEERARIMKNGFRALKSIDERSKRRLDEIKRGVYRDTTSSATPTPEGLE